MTDQPEYVTVAQMMQRWRMTRRRLMTLLSGLDKQHSGELLLRTPHKIYVRLDILKREHPKLMAREARVDDVEGALKSMERDFNNLRVEVEVLKAIVEKLETTQDALLSRAAALERANRK